MKRKRTGFKILQYFESSLVLIGRPLLYSFLYGIFALTVIVTGFYSLLIQLFKATFLYVKKATIETYQTGNVLSHIIRLYFKKYSLLLQTPIKHIISFPRLPYVQIQRKYLKIVVNASKLFKPTLKILAEIVITSKYHFKKIQNQLTSFLNSKKHKQQSSKPRDHKRKQIITLPKPVLVIMLSILVVGITSAYAYIHTLISSLPNPNNLIERQQILSTKIYDRNGTLLYKIYKNENRTLTTLENIPQQIIQATIAIEDKEFYSHIGYSYTGIVRAIRQTVFEGNIQGGSTITQQLVKNALLTHEQTLERKIKEIILAILVEAKFTKDEILTMYFNEVGFGGAAYGIEEASQLYFGKSARNLSLAEASLVAGLPAAPTHYSPFGTHPERAKFRQHEVLRRMEEENFITKEEMEKAKNEKISFAVKRIDILAPHFVMYVKEKLVEMYGEQMVEQGGLNVTTSLDINTQQLAQSMVTQELETLKKLNVSNGAALVTVPSTGEILAMVGSKDYFNTTEDGQVNVTIQPRQPGSSIKPINYAAALENGFTAATILEDTPTTFLVQGQPPYTPRNYDNAYHGNITLRQALANSYNIPAVKTLAKIGVEKMIEKGKQMGITTWDDENRFGLSLTLGGGEVTMVDLAQVYGTLANNGFHMALQPILNVTDSHGNVVFSYHCQTHEISTGNFTSSKFGEIMGCNPTKVVEPEIAFILTDILSDNEARSQAFGRFSVLNIPGHHVAVKTGTTQNLRDNWTIGYTTNFLVATWVGNNNNSPMSYVASGITGASPIWNKIMSTLLTNNQEEEPVPPDSLVQVDICPYTGTLPCESCGGKKEYFIKGTEPKKACVPTPKNEESSPTQETNLQAFQYESIDVQTVNQKKRETNE